MILLKLINGWPDRVVSWDHSGNVPKDHKAFESIDEMDAWKMDNPDAAPVPPEEKDPTPDLIPMWAFRRALRKRKMLDGILAFIGSLPEQQKLDAMEHLEYGNYIERNHPMIVGSAQQLGLSESTVDNIFREGSQEK